MCRRTFRGISLLQLYPIATLVLTLLGQCTAETRISDRQGGEQGKRCPLKMANIINFDATLKHKNPEHVLKIMAIGVLDIIFVRHKPKRN